MVSVIIILLIIIVLIFWNAPFSLRRDKSNLYKSKKDLRK